MAEKISKHAKQELINVLTQRSQDWGFDYELGTWSGKSYSCLGKGPQVSIPITMLKGITFPSMPWPKENRSPKLDVKAFRIIAEEQGVSETFDYFIDRISQHGLSIICHRDSMNIRAPIANATKKLNVIGIWPGDSNEKGLCVSAERKRLIECFPNGYVKQQSPPGECASGRGFLGPRFYLNNLSEAKQFWEWATGIKQA